MKVRRYLLLLFLLLCPLLAEAGFVDIDNCDNFPTVQRIANGTFCLQRTTASGRDAGTSWVWSGSAWKSQDTLDRVTVANLPGSPTLNQVLVVTDATAAGSCLTGGGTVNIICQWTGSTWVFLGGGGGGGPGPGGSGTVTSVSAGGLSPLFTSNVTDPSGAAAITFTLTDQAQNLVFAGPSGSSGAPSFRALVSADLPTVAVTQGGTGLTTLTAHGVLIGAGASNLAVTSAGTAGQCLLSNGASADPSFGVCPGAGTGAPTTSTYITQTPDATLSNEQALSLLATGILKNTTATGILSIATAGTDYYAPGSTDVAVADGGTGASTAAAARTNLGVVPGTNVFTQRTFQDQSNVLTWTDGDGVSGNPAPKLTDQVIDGSSHFATDTGTANAYAACPQSISTRTSAALADKSIHGFTAANANTGASTVNFCIIGVRSIVKVAGGVTTALAANDIRAGQNVILQYNSSNSTFQMQSPVGNAPSGLPDGSDTQVQFNDAGAFRGDAGFTYNKTTDIASLAGGLVLGSCGANCVTIGQAVTGTWTYTYDTNANGSFLFSTGTKTSGNGTKFNAAGQVVDGGARYKTCQIENDTQSATVLTSAQITGRCDIDVAGTLVEVAVYASTGTPSVLLERWRPNGGAVADLTTATLPTQASGAYQCARSSASATGIAGITCHATITLSASTTINAGDVIRVKSASITGSPTWHHVKATVQY